MFIVILLAALSLSALDPAPVVAAGIPCKARPSVVCE